MDSKDINFSPKNGSSLKRVTGITRPTNKYKSDESKRISAGADKKRKRRKRKHRNLNYNYKGSKNKKHEKWKKHKDMKKLEVKQEGILDVDKSRNKVPPDQMTTNGKLELPTANNHSEESPHKSKTKHSKSRNISGDFIRKKKNKTDVSSTKNDPKRQMQKHNKRHHGKGIKEKSNDSEIAEGTDEKPGPTIGKTTKTKVASRFKQDKKKLGELNSKSSSVKDSKGANELKKSRTKKKKSEKKLATEKTSGANKTKRTTGKQKSLNGSGTDSKSITGSEKKEKKKKAKKLCGKKGRDFKPSVKYRKSSQKIRVRNVAPKEKDRSISGKQSESVSESAKKEKRKKVKSKERKTRKLSEDLCESESVRNKKKAKKRKNTSKSTNELCKIKKRKARKVKSHHIYKGKDENEINEKIKLEEETEKMRERGTGKSKSNKKFSFRKKVKRVDEILKSGSEKENKEREAQGKLSSRRKRGKSKRGRKIQEVQRRKDKSSEDTMVTKQSISTSAALSEREKSDDDTQQTDQKDSPTGEKKEQMAATEKQPEEKLKKPKVNDMTTMKRIPYGMKKTEETNSDAAQRPESSEEPAITVMPNKIKEKKVMDESSPSNVVLSATSTSVSCSDQDANSRIPDEELERKMKFKQEFEHVEDSRKATMTGSPAYMNPETEDNEANKSQDRSYVDGLVQIRTILEIYGIDEEKTEAFNKLLDEDMPMTEKEIAANLRKAVCDLPMDKELLEKVLKKMRFSGLLRKQEHEMLEKNLVPQAVNESVTIALLAQVLQRQKLKKSTS
ncbi:unnamed protein product [Wuchereria bancrofti]|uniref:Uncharacterized protein n=1 Tax=Wuchereria bancrofti TaxID=6293 RepID=A0A3P7DK61_WUCBA|nr:unnamed protein product [Wuchereria bancrofti]